MGEDSEYTRLQKSADIERNIGTATLPDDERETIGKIETFLSEMTDDGTDVVIFVKHRLDDTSDEKIIFQYNNFINISEASGKMGTSSHMLSMVDRARQFSAALSRFINTINGGGVNTPLGNVIKTVDD